MGALMQGLARRERRLSKRKARLGEEPSGASSTSRIPKPALIAGGIIGALGLIALVAKRQAVSTAVKGAASAVTTFASGITAKAVNTVGDLQRAVTALATTAAIAPYATELYNAGAQNGINPLLLAALMWRESNAGLALQPRGPGGTGDFGKRKAGQQWRQASGKYYVVPATGMPEDGQGWGRGLMQLDWAVYNEWLTKNDWKNPAVNITKAALELKLHFDFFQRKGTGPVAVECWRLSTGMPQNRIAPWRVKYAGHPLPMCGPTDSKAPVDLIDPRPLSGALLNAAAMAAYNAGDGGVLQAVALGLPPEAATTGQDYVSWVNNLLTQWGTKLS